MCLCFQELPLAHKSLSLFSFKGRLRKTENTPRPRFLIVPRLKRCPAFLFFLFLFPGDSSDYVDETSDPFG